MTDPLDLDALAALETAATPGPWDEDGWWACVRCGADDPELYVPIEDRAFIAAARNALPALIDRVRTAEADRDAYRARIDAVRALCDDVIDGSGLVALIRAALDGEA